MLDQCVEDFIGKSRGERRVGQVFKSAGKLAVVELPEPGDEALILFRQPDPTGEVDGLVGKLTTVSEDVVEESVFLVVRGGGGFDDLLPEVSEVVVGLRRVGFGCYGKVSNEDKTRV